MRQEGREERKQLRSRRRAAKEDVGKSRMRLVESEMASEIETNRNSEDQINSERAGTKMEIVELEKRGKQTERQKRTDQEV